MTARIWGTHKHKCPACARVWRHGNWNGGNDRAHECPNCGTEQRWWYCGPDEPPAGWLRRFIHRITGR